jgi:hypothetical protein
MIVSTSSKRCFPLFFMAVRTYRRIISAYLITCLVSVSIAVAQPLVAGSINTDPLRNAQITGRIPLSFSFTVYPFSASSLVSDDSVQNIAGLWQGQTKYFDHKKGKYGWLPAGILQQFNSHHPYGWNDGGMIPAKGYQTMLSAGGYAEWGPLRVQVAPEFVFAANPAYSMSTEYGSNSGVSFRKIYGGQSAISLSAGALSVSVSTENLWWGPGRYSSLLMSNNAPGFLHAGLHTRRPVRTPVGSFEFQLIGGKLSSDSKLPYENFHLQNRSFPDDWRYLNAYIISFQPRWTPGLYIGMTRAIQRYNKDLSLSGSSVLNKYMPVISKAFQKSNAQADDTMRTDQLASFFLRWVLPKAGMEVYGEYGFNDYNQNVRDYLMNPSHSAAYILGARKILPAPGNAYVEIGLELTHMTQAPNYLIREAGNWYVHGDIKQGYVNDNQILGAGAGQGANLLVGSVALVKKTKRLGFIFEKTERDPQYHAYQWTDYGLGIMPQVQYGKILLRAKAEGILSRQYAWIKDNNQFNLHCTLHVLYQL